MNIAVVDDRKADRDNLRAVLGKYAAMHQLDMEIECFPDAESFLAGYRPLLYTVIFLDIYMEGMSGVEAAGKIREVDDEVLLVFLTTSEEHRAEAFRHYASAYLIKSSEDGIIFRTLDHIFHLHGEKAGKRFVFVCDRREIGLRYDDIISLQSSGNYLEITDKNGNSWRTRMLLSEAQQMLSGDRRFITIIRGVIVNLDHVARINGRICETDSGLTFPVSSLKSKKIEQIWHNYNFEKLRRASLWERQ